MNDWELLREYVQTRSQPAFAQLVERHVRWVHSTCARQLGDAHLAEDVTQAVFLLLAQKAARLTPQTSITGWLFRSARLMSANAMKMQRRRARRDLRAAVMAQQQSSRAGSHDDVSGAKNESELLLALDSAMTRLRAQDRDVLLLRFYNNRSVAEAAQELNISIDAAKKRFARSLDALRQLLADQGVAVPAAGGAMMILSAIAPTTAEAVPATLTNWIAAGASPATASARASEIVRSAGMKKLLAVVLASAAALMLAAASIYVWPTRSTMPSPAVAVAPPRPAATPTPPLPAPTAAPSSAPVTPSPAAPSIQPLTGHDAWITAASISADGRYGVSRSTKQLLRWDLASAKQIGDPVTIREQPIGLAISPAGKIVATDRTDLLVFDTFDAATPRRLTSKAPPQMMPWSLAIASAGDKVAAGGADGVIRLIDPTSGAETAALRGHTGIVSVLVFSPDDRQLLSGGWDHSVRLWDLTTGKELRSFDGHTSAVHGVGFSRDGKHAISFARSLRGPKGREEADPFVRIWDLSEDARHMKLLVPAPVVHAVTFMPDGHRAMALVDKELFVWDLADGRVVEQRTILPHSCTPSCATFSSDGRQLLVGGEGPQRNILLKVDLGVSATVAAPAK